MRHYIRHLFLILFIVTTAFVSKAQQPTGPIELNDVMADITDTLYVSGSQWGKAFGDAYKSGRYDLLKPHRQRLERLVNEKMEYVLTLKDINNSKPLRLAVIEFLSYEKHLIEEAFVPFESLTANATKEQVKKMLDNLSTIASKETEKLGKVQDAQYRYAEENGFTIQK